VKAVLARVMKDNSQNQPDFLPVTEKADGRIIGLLEITP
jgi:hypothetical protein